MEKTQEKVRFWKLTWNQGENHGKTQEKSDLGNTMEIVSKLWAKHMDINMQENKCVEQRVSWGMMAVNIQGSVQAMRGDCLQSLL